MARKYNLKLAIKVSWLPYAKKVADLQFNVFFTFT